MDLELFDWIVDNFPSEPWGVFLSTDAALENLDKLRAHFQQFTSALHPDGEEVYFRFYDPRVLPAYLSTCHREEANSFFGPVRCFYFYDIHGKLLSINLEDN